MDNDTIRTNASKTARPMYLAIASLLLVTSACVIQAGDNDDNDDGEGGAGTATGNGANTGTGDDGSGGSGAAGSGGSGPITDDGVGPSADPMPEASEPGAHVCAGCPEAVMETSDVDAGTETVFTLSGKADGQSGQGRFIVINEIGQFAGGGVLVDAETGNFEQTVPLFCGQTLLKVFFSNEAGTSAFVRHIENAGCLEADVRVTVAWDETTREWTNHLVRFGGTIHNASTDCYASNSCYPGSHTTDWGVDDDVTDNPVLDTDGFHDYMGVENIYYPGAEDGLKVLIENGGAVDGLTPSATLYINVHDQPTYVKQIAVLHPKEVLIAAKVDGASGDLTVIDEVYDCASEWTTSCQAAIP